MINDVGAQTLERVAAQALVTYRTLRVALFGALGLLVVSILFTVWRDDWAVLGSISAYVHTTTEAVFVGTLIAIGMSVLVVRGTDDEELWLNIAGMLAPVVALVPVAPQGFEELPEPLVANVRNNVGALLVVALVALVALWKWPRDAQADPVRRQALWRALVAYTAIVVGIGVAFLTWDSARSHLHYVAAIPMFVCFGVVALRNWQRHDAGTYRSVYRFVTIGMATAAVVVLAWKALSEWIAEVLPVWNTSVFWLEVVEILLFAGLWLAQTIERWDDLDTSG
jgi:hypothetical protein